MCNFNPNLSSKVVNVFRLKCDKSLLKFIKALINSRNKINKTKTTQESD